MHYHVCLLLQDEEVAMLSELSHLQEVVDQVQKLTTDPFTLPPASEQVLFCLDICVRYLTLRELRGMEIIM